MGFARFDDDRVMQLSSRRHWHCDSIQLPPRKINGLSCEPLRPLVRMNLEGRSTEQSVSITNLSQRTLVMLHYTCDCCKRPIDPEQELRYVVRVEVYAALDPMQDESDDEHDHLQEIQDILDRLDDVDDERISDDVYQQKRLRPLQQLP